MKLSRWIPLTLSVLAAFTLAACTGTPAQLESVEVGAGPQGETEMEFAGAVDSIGSNAWSIGGLVVGVTASTEITGEPVVGDIVRVHALVLDGSTLVAREIARAEAALGAEPTPVATPVAGEEIEFFGSVVNIASDAWTVGVQTVAITSATEIKGTISVGDPVKVHALVQPDLSLTAREIEPATEADLLSGDDSSGSAEDVELKGIVEKIVGDEWTVASVTFVVPPGTAIDGAVQVGDSVEIHAVWSAGGVLTAIRIHLEDGPGDDASSGDDSGDDNSGSGQGDDSNDDNSGSGGGDDDNSGSGGGDDDNSGSGG
jgi:hypothetical protein